MPRAVRRAGVQRWDLPLGRTPQALEQNSSKGDHSHICEKQGHMKRDQRQENREWDPEAQGNQRRRVVL